MNRNQSKVILSIAAAIFAFIAGCANMPSAEVVTDGFQIDLADSRP